MKERIAVIAERFEAFTLRERLWISAAVILVLSLVWDSLFLNPEKVQQEKLVGEMYSINQQMEDINGQIEVMTRSLQGSERQRIERRMTEVQSLLARLNQQQQDLTVEFIPPKQMAAVLREMLTKNSHLELRRLESLGVSPLFPKEEETDGKPAADVSQVAADSHEPTIYKHGMRVVLEGDFFGTLKYLQALENMPVHFYWDNVEYEVLKYPKARVTITLHTLSLDEGWIGV